MLMPAYGWLPPTPDSRDRIFAPPRAYTGTFTDLSAAFPQEPYDQGELGSCVSNATAGILDFARAKQGLAPFDCPSRLFIYYNGRVRGGYPVTEDTGLQVRDGLTVVAKDGAPAEGIWPYDITKFTEKPSTVAYAQGKKDIAVAYGQVDQHRVDDTIAAGYPVVFGFNVKESFEYASTAKTGIMPIPAASERSLGGHCVVAVSTVKDGSAIGGASGVLYRKVRNSWGATWGQAGYFWMPLNVMDGSDASDFWMLTHVSDPDAPPPPPLDADHAFAAALRPWATSRHVGDNHTVAVAAQGWLKARSL